MLSTTILAARRVLPPDLITPAEASAAFMKDTGPEAVPPPANCSLAERIFDKLTPEPEPPLKIIPSLRYQSRIDSMVSSTARMKQAEHWGFASMPQLNHTGLLKQAFWWTNMWVSSSWKAWASSSLAKYPSFRPQPVIVSTTRPIIWRTLCSLCGLPSGPRKYFETTTLVAIRDQAFGISTLFCSKTTLPFSLVIEAERCSHSISSYGATPTRVKYRLILSPFWLLGSPSETLNPVTCDIVVAIALTPFALGLSIYGVNHAGNVLDFVLVKLLKNFVKKNFLLPSYFLTLTGSHQNLGATKSCRVSK